MSAKVKFDKKLKDEFIRAYVENDMHLGNTCQAIGITRPTFYKAKKWDDEFAKEIENIEKGIDDLLFNYIMEGLKDHDTRLAYLKLLSTQRIDRIMSRGDNSFNDINKDDIVLR